MSQKPVWTDGQGRVRSTGSSSSPYVDPELHPFVARPSVFEPILTTGQKLTPAQKEHLAQFQDRDALFDHLSSYHGISLLKGTEADLAHPIDPQVAQRFGIGKRDINDTVSLLGIHTYLHLNDYEERARTAPNVAPLTAEEYAKAGIDKAPGFQQATPTTLSTLDAIAGKYNGSSSLAKLVNRKHKNGNVAQNIGGPGGPTF